MMRANLSQDTLDAVKTTIYQREGYPIERLTFILNGKLLGHRYQEQRQENDQRDLKTLIDYGVKEDSTLILMVREARLLA